MRSPLHLYRLSFENSSGLTWKMQGIEHFVKQLQNIGSLCFETHALNCSTVRAAKFTGLFENPGNHQGVREQFAKFADRGTDIVSQLFMRRTVHPTVCINHRDLFQINPLDLCDRCRSNILSKFADRGRRIGSRGFMRRTIYSYGLHKDLQREVGRLLRRRIARLLYSA